MAFDVNRDGAEHAHAMTPARKEGTEAQDRVDRALEDWTRELPDL